MFKKLVAVVGTLSLAAGLSLVAVAAPATAAPSMVSGAATCDSTSGTTTIEWSVTGDSYYPDSVATVESESLDPSESEEPALVPSLVGHEIQADDPYSPGSVTSVQSGALASTTYTLTLELQWSDGHSEVVSGEVTTGECAAPAIADAAASVTVAAPTCDTETSLSLNTPVKATWGDIVREGDTYTVVATAIGSSIFSRGIGVSSDGTTQTFTVDIEPQLSAAECAPLPDCIPSSAVSYTYNGPENQGIITVADVSSTSGTLCQGFWVTATSWKFTTAAMWPQTLDQLDYVNGKQEITLPGTYPFQAVMTCGQGDIYASFTEQPEPALNLYGPSNGYKEHFLHQMGFTGPNPTYFVQKTGCNAVTPVEPTVTTAAQCGVQPSVVVPDTTGVEYTVEFDQATGDYTVTATPKANYILSTKEQVTTFTGNAGIYRECANAPDARVALGTCNPAGDDGQLPLARSAFARTVAAVPASGPIATLTFDNTRSDRAVEFTVVGFPAYSRTVPAGQSELVVVPRSNTDATSFTVLALDKTFVLPVPACALPTLALVTPGYSVTQPTCSQAGSYTLTSVVGDITWTVNGVAGITSGTYAAPTDGSTVTIVAAPTVAGDGLDPDWTNPTVLTFTTLRDACMFAPPTLALFDPPTLAYTGSSVGSGIGLGGVLLLLGFGAVLIAHRRKLQGE